MALLFFEMDIQLISIFAMSPPPSWEEKLQSRKRMDDAFLAQRKNRKQILSDRRNHFLKRLRRFVKRYEEEHGYNGAVSQIEETYDARIAIQPADGNARLQAAKTVFHLWNTSATRARVVVRLLAHDRVLSKEQWLDFAYEEYDLTTNLFQGTTEDTTEIVYSLSSLPIYSRRERESWAVFDDYRKKLRGVAGNELRDYELKESLKEDYLALITSGREDRLQYVGADVFIPAREEALRQVLNVRGTTPARAALVFLCTYRYDAVAVGRVLPSFLVFLGLFVAPPVINYRDETQDLTFLIPKALQGDPALLQNQSDIFAEIPETFDQGDNLDDFAELPFQSHSRRVIMDFPRRPLITIQEDQAVAFVNGFLPGLRIMAGSMADDRLIRRLLTHTYDSKLRSRGIPGIDRDYYLTIRLGMALNTIAQLGGGKDHRVASLLIFLAHNDVVVTEVVLKDNATHAFFSAGGAAQIFTSPTTNTSLPIFESLQDMQVPQPPLPVGSTQPSGNPQSQSVGSAPPTGSTQARPDQPSQVAPQQESRPDSFQTNQQLESTEDGPVQLSLLRTPSPTLSEMEAARAQFYDVKVPKGLNPLDTGSGFPPKTAGILSDRWLWEVREVQGKIRGNMWKKTFSNKGAVRANVNGNGEPVILKNPTTGKDHYAVVYGNVQLIGTKERIDGNHKVLVDREASTKSAYYLGDEVIVSKIGAKDKGKKRALEEQDRQTGKKAKSSLDLKAALEFESDIELSVSDEEIPAGIASADADAMIVALVKGFAQCRKEQLRMQSIAKLALTTELSKTERKVAQKSFSAIKDAADGLLEGIASEYPALAFLNPRRLPVEETTDMDQLPHVGVYEHPKELEEYLAQGNHVLEKEDSEAN